MNGMVGEFLGSVFANGAELVGSAGNTFCKPQLEACGIDVHEASPQDFANVAPKPGLKRNPAPFV